MYGPRQCDGIEDANLKWCYYWREVVVVWSVECNIRHRPKEHNFGLKKRGTWMAANVIALSLLFQCFWLLKLCIPFALFICLLVRGPYALYGTPTRARSNGPCYCQGWFWTTPCPIPKWWVSHDNSRNFCCILRVQHSSEWRCIIIRPT